MKCVDISWDDLIEEDRDRRDFEIGDWVWNPKGGEPHVITHTEKVQYWGAMHYVNELRCECGDMDIDHHYFMLRKNK
jgi:hypothetical protein